MRKLAVTLALATTALSTPALARDDAWYVGVEAGPMIVEDIDFTIDDVDAGSVDSEAGFDVGGTIGYDFGGFRLEAEASYRRATVDSITVNAPFFATVLHPAGTYDGAGGNTSALSFMINGMLDFGDDDGLQGFIGGGAGIARVSADYGISTQSDLIDDSDTVFAWQAIAGVRAPITDNIDVQLKYRFFNAENVKLVVDGDEFEGRFRSHSLLGGFVFNFGEPPAPPPEPAPAPAPAWTPPPEPAPAPTPAPICTPGPYIVFFDWDKSDITPEAAGILDNAISNYQSCGTAQVQLAGHADRSGSASYNVGLSQRRADAVEAYLTGRGIPSGVISKQAFGESQPRVATADGVRELQNRRVEILYQGQ